MSQPVTVSRLHIVSDEDAPLTGNGYPSTEQAAVEAEAERRGALVAVATSCGYGWDEMHRYDPREADR